MNDKVIQFPKSDNQLLSDAEKYGHQAESYLRDAESAFLRAFHKGMLEAFEAEDQQAKKGGFRRKLKAAGFSDEDCDPIVMSYRSYQKYLENYNELRRRGREDPVSLRELFDLIDQQKAEQRKRIRQAVR